MNDDQDDERAGRLHQEARVQEIEADRIRRYVEELQKNPGSHFEIRPGGAQYVPVTAEPVLREMISLLKDLLDKKGIWFETALAEEQERSKALQARLDEAAEKEVKLRVALGQAAESLYAMCNSADEYKCDADWRQEIENLANGK